MNVCPAAAEEKIIENLLISVNEKVCTTGETLLAVYKENINKC